MKSSGDLFLIVISREKVSWNRLFERKTLENILGASYLSISVVIVKVSFGGKWTRKVSSKSETVTAGIAPVNVFGVDVIVNNEPPCWMLLAGCVSFMPPSLRVCCIQSKNRPNLTPGFHEKEAFKHHADISCNIARVLLSGQAHYKTSL